MIQSTLKAAYFHLVVGNQKAIAGFVLTVAVGVFSRVGIHGDMSVAEAIRTLTEAAIVSGGVWFKANK